MFVLSLGALRRAEEAGVEEAKIEELAAWTLEKESAGRPGLAQAVKEHRGALDFLEADPSWRTMLADSPAVAELDGYLADAREVRRSESFLTRFGFVPARVTATGLVGHMFLHGGLLHLLGNMVFLWAVGGFLEKRWGPRWYLALYLGAGLAAALAHALTHRSSLEPAIGASGAIAGLMGACLAGFPRARIRLLLVYSLALVPRYRVLAVPAAVFLGFWLVEQVFWTSLTSGMRVQVAYMAHLGGFAFGGLAVLASRIASGASPGIEPVRPRAHRAPGPGRVRPAEVPPPPAPLGSQARGAATPPRTGSGPKEPPAPALPRKPAEPPPLPSSRPRAKPAEPPIPPRPPG